jgi:hypothetical protein
MNGHSDSEMQALAYAVTAQYDSNPLIPDQHLKNLNN